MGGQGAAGVSFCGGGPPIQPAIWDQLDPDRSIVLWPPEIRRCFEVDALITAAGDAAEHCLFWAQTPGAVRIPEPVHVAASDMVISKASDMVISEAERNLFISAVDRPDPPTSRSSPGSRPRSTRTPSPRGWPG